MSEALHVLRVHFENGRGVVNVLGWRKELTAAPSIAGLPRIQAIDFDYTSSCYRLLPHMGAWRDMLRDEVPAVIAWLRGVYDQHRGGGK